jgi:hypothetical protein
MSQASSTGSWDDLQATMKAILQRLDKLDTIEERIGALEAKLPELQPLQDQVTLLGGGGDDATSLVIGAIGTDSSLDRGDILAAISSGTIGAICGGGGHLDANALRVGSDDGTGVLLGNCTTVVLAGDNLGGAAIWHRPKRRQRSKLRRGQSWAGQRHPRCARLEREHD